MMSMATNQSGVVKSQEADTRGLEAFRPIRMRTVSEEVVAAIVDAIRVGLYEPGSRLPRERDLAAALHVSRANVREGVHILERAGIVSMRRGNTGGTVVQTRLVPPEVIAAVEGDAYWSWRSTLEARRALEMAAALATGQRATDEELQDLRRLVEKLEGLMNEPQEFIAVDQQFHLKLAEMSQNPILARYIKSVFARILFLRARDNLGHPMLQNALERQCATLEAIESRDPARIRKSMDEHLAGSEELFLGERLSQLTDAT